MIHSYPCGNDIYFSYQRPWGFVARCFASQAPTRPPSWPALLPGARKPVFTSEGTTCLTSLPASCANNWCQWPFCPTPPGSAPPNCARRSTTAARVTPASTWTPTCSTDRWLLHWPRLVHVRPSGLSSGMERYLGWDQSSSRKCDFVISARVW